MQAIVVVTVRSRIGAGCDTAAVGQEVYWLDQIARDRCEYYSGKGESPGWWAGRLADRAGLQAEASEAAVRRLFAGQDPATGEQRVAPVWRADPRSKLRAAPLQAALREFAAAHGLEVGELAAGGRPRRDLQAVLSARGKVSVAVVEQVCRMGLGRNPAELYGEGYAEARKHAGRRVDARVASFAAGVRIAACAWSEGRTSPCLYPPLPTQTRRRQHMRSRGAMASVAELADEHALRRLAGPIGYRQGVDLAVSGCVQLVSFGPVRVTARVEDLVFQHVELRSTGTAFRWSCTCRDGERRAPCKHSVAVAVETRQRISSQRR